MQVSLLDEDFRDNWKNYLWQSIAAGISVFLILALLIQTINLVIIAAIGASTFTVFAIPHHKTAQARSVIGGQAFGIIVGLVCSYIPILSVQGGLAIALVTILMVSFDAEHPPAAGTALGLAVSPSLEGVAFIISAAVILTIIRRSLSDHLVDLT